MKNKNKQGEKKMKTIEVKKYNTQAEALEVQKSITGRYYYEGFVRNSLDTIMDKAKNNNLPYMVDTSNGDIYYIFTCDDNLQCLNKFQTHGCITSYPFKKVSLKENIIEIEEQGSVQKNKANRKLLAEQNQIVA